MCGVCLNLDFWVDIATIAAPLIALGGLGLIWWQLRDNAKQSRLQRSYEFAGKYHSPEYLRHMIDASSFMKSSDGIDKKWEDFNNDKTIRNSVGIFLSFFEEIGAMYNMGLVDKGVIEKLLKPPTIAYFELSKPFIDKMREGREDKDPAIHDQWETMYNDLNET